MSLPPRKKSVEEIAKLRESLGVPGPQSVQEIPTAPDTHAVHVKALAIDEPIQHERSVLSSQAATSATKPLLTAPHLEPLSVSDFPAPKPVRSLRRSERILVLPVEESAVLSTPTLREKVVLPALQSARPVRSLRKSEQVPVTGLSHSLADSQLPVHRHNDREINEIRRQEAIALLTPQVPPKPMIAHLALVIPGYLAAAAGAACFYFYDIEKRQMPFTATCAAIALLVAAVIFIRSPLSRHHAAFIAVMALFVIVFSALYYFPQLQHGT